MSLRFLLDEDQDPRVAAGLRPRGIDARSVHDLGRANQAVTDAAWLEEATAQRRVFVTYNRADFQALDDQWRSAGRTHGGILWCMERSIPRRAIGDLVRALEAAAQLYDTLDGLCLPLTRAPEAEEQQPAP